MEQQIFIVGYKTYDFTDNDGVVHEGIKISYLPCNHSNNGKDTFGWLPIQMSLPMDFLKKLNGTGIYLSNVNMVAGAGNKPKFELSNLEFIKSVDISKIF